MSIILKKTETSNDDNTLDKNAEDIKSFINDKIKITIINPFENGGTYILDVNDDSTIGSIKKRLSTMDKCHIELMRLVIGGKQLLDDYTIAECGINANTQIYLIPRKMKLKARIS